MTDNYATVYRRKKVKGYSLHDMSDALRHRVVLALQEAGVLDKDERLTEDAVNQADVAIGKDSKLKNPSVVAILTKNGNSIEDWGKFKTKSTLLSGGQHIEVHFYKNKMTGEVNYTHRDFKVKNSVSATITNGIKYNESQLDKLLKPRK